jgi:hypothetical protein
LFIMEEEKFSELVVRYSAGQYVGPFSELEKKALELVRLNSLDYAQMGKIMDEVKRKLLERSDTPL